MEIIYAILILGAFIGGYEFRRRTEGKVENVRVPVDEPVNEPVYMNPVGEAGATPDPQQFDNNPPARYNLNEPPDLRKSQLEAITQDTMNVRMGKVKGAYNSLEG